jgi:hypothetical protein
MQLRPVTGGSATGEHFVQFYASEAAFATTLEGFIVEGLRADEAVIVIATQPHLEEMERRLRMADVDLVAARWRGQYIPVEAEGMLVRIMGDTLPDAGSFRAELESLIAQAGRRRLRGFGEMVSILQARGMHEAVIRLEELWSTVCAEQKLTLLCAYPRNVFEEDETDGMTRICEHHTHVVVDAVGR